MTPWPAMISGRWASAMRLRGLRPGRSGGRAGRRDVLSPASATRPPAARPPDRLLRSARPSERRPAPAPGALPSPLQRLADRIGQLVDLLHQDRLCLVIGWVMPMMSVSWKASRPSMAREHLPGDGDDGRAVHVRRGETGHEVGRAGARGRHAHAGTAGSAGVAVGRVGGGLLVPHQHVPSSGYSGQRVIERHDRSAGISEEEVRRPPRRGPGRGFGSRVRTLSHSHAPQVDGVERLTTRAARRGAPC